MSKRKQTYRSPAEIQAFLDDLDSDAEFSDLSDESEKEGNYFKFCLQVIFIRKNCHECLENV